MNNHPQSRKNWALFFVLIGLVVILFIITIIRFGGAALHSAGS